MAREKSTSDKFDPTQIAPEEYKKLDADSLQWVLGNVLQWALERKYSKNEIQAITDPIKTSITVRKELLFESLIDEYEKIADRLEAAAAELNGAKPFRLQPPSDADHEN